MFRVGPGSSFYNAASRFLAQTAVRIDAGIDRVSPRVTEVVRGVDAVVLEKLDVSLPQIRQSVASHTSGLWAHIAPKKMESDLPHVGEGASIWHREEDALRSSSEQPHVGKGASIWNREDDALGR